MLWPPLTWWCIYIIMLRHKLMSDLLHLFSKLFNIRVMQVLLHDGFANCGRYNCVSKWRFVKQPRYHGLRSSLNSLEVSKLFSIQALFCLSHRALLSKHLFMLDLVIEHLLVAHLAIFLVSLKVLVNLLPERILLHVS